MNTYKYILFNAGTLSYKELINLSSELNLLYLAHWLKHKFNDSRSASQLVKLIKSEYNLQ